MATMSISYPNHSLGELANDTGRCDAPRDSLRDGVMPPRDQGSPRAQGDRSPLRNTALIFIILLGLFFSVLDTSIVSTALINISTELNNDYLNAPWVIQGYLLSYMAGAIGFARLSDVFGRHIMCLVAWSFFSGFSITCALASNMPLLIWGRILQGIGGSGLYSLAQICLLEIGPSRPALVGALVGATIATSYVLGPVLGGLISSYWTWRGIFYINIPFGVLASATFFWQWYHEDAPNDRPTWTNVDHLGIILQNAGSALLVYALQQGSSISLLWNDAKLITVFVLSGCSWIGFFIWEAALVKGHFPSIKPIFPHDLAFRRIYVCGLVTTFFTGWTYVSLVIMIPERLQIIHHDSSLWAGLHLLPMLGCCAVGSFLAGLASKRKNRTGPALVIAALLQLLGIILLYLSTAEDMNLRPIFGYTAVFGLGVGVCFAAATMLAGIEARNLDLAAAQGAVAQVRVFGGCIGLSACTAIFNAHVQCELMSVLSASELDAIHRSPTAILSLPALVQPMIKTVYVAAFKTQVLSMILVAIVAIIASLGTLQRNPTPVVQMMAQHSKESLARASDMELEDLRRHGQANARIDKLSM